MGYIFEQEIEAIIRSVRVKTIGEEEGIRLWDILKADVHPGIKAYFKEEVERLLRSERAKEVRSARFPYTLAEVVSLQKQIDLILVKQYVFTRDEFDRLADEAVHFQFNYLCRPQWTLLNFIFRQQRKVVLSTIEQRLKYCIDYVYFPRIIRRYVEARGLVEVTFEEFRKLLARIDAEIIATQTNAQLANMMHPLFAFLESGLPQPYRDRGKIVIPVNAAIVFMEDKSLESVKNVLESERDRKGRTLVTVEDLRQLLDEAREEPEIQAPSGDVPFSALESLFTPEVMSEIPPASVQTPLQPAAKETRVAAPAALSYAEKTNAPPPSQEPHVSRQDDAAMSHLDMADIITMFIGSSAKIFIKKLFRRDEVEFRSALEELSGMKTWGDVSVFLDRLFTKNGVDPYSSEAVRFTDTLYEYFRPPGEAVSAE